MIIKLAETGHMLGFLTINHRFDFVQSLYAVYATDSPAQQKCVAYTLQHQRHTWTGFLSCHQASAQVARRNGTVIQKPMESANNTETDSTGPTEPAMNVTKRTSDVNQVPKAAKRLRCIKMVLLDRASFKRYMQVHSEAVCERRDRRLALSDAMRNFQQDGKIQVGCFIDLKMQLGNDFYVEMARGPSGSFTNEFQTTKFRNLQDANEYVNQFKLVMKMEGYICVEDSSSIGPPTNNISKQDVKSQ